VKLDKNQPLDFDSWIHGVKNGRSYCGDGMSHILDLKVGDVAMGEPGSGGKISQLDLAKPGKVKVAFDAAALLAPKPTEATERVRKSRLDEKPYWHIERCRVGNSRKVPVEIIVNGKAVAHREIVADGKTRPMSFDIDIKQSSWVAVRILPSVHTNPVFIEVGEQPIRASRRSADWCIKAVDTCWNAKQGRIRENERVEAKLAYGRAKSIYEKIKAECVAE
jgi:hypothetical protein